MKISYSAAELFLSYLCGESTLDDVVEHKAYKTVFSHGYHFGNKITKEDIEAALRGESTSFYGLTNLRENLLRIENLITIIKKNESQWLKDVSTIFSSLLPEEDIHDIIIYPIIGYDAGIGLNDVVCMSLNWNQYLDNPHEFLYYMIHETFHVLYERIHEIPPLKSVVTPTDWLAYFRLFLHNEGYAVYAPLHLREERGHVADEDYAVLLDEKKIKEHIEIFMNTLELLKQKLLTPDEYCDHIFGPHRLTYRVGCELIRRIEKVYDFEEVRKGIYLESNQFFSKYEHLLAE